MKCFLSIIFISVFISGVLAQDTEHKDEKTIITVYIKLKMERTPCHSCFDSLKERLNELDGVKNIKVFLGTSQVRFHVLSDKVPSEEILISISEKTGLNPIRILFEKEEPETDDDLKLN